MTCSRKYFLATGCVAILCGTLIAATEPGKNDKEKPKAKDKSAQGAKPKKADEKKASDELKEDGEKQPSKLVIPLPKGQDSKGVTIPYTDGSGKKTMVFKIGIGTRIDEEHVKMKDLLIETFDEAGTQEMTITLPNSLLDMTTRTITGDESVTVSRSDFQITGKNMEFNTESRKGWIKGDVKMIIYDLTEESVTTPGKSDAASTNQKPKGS